MRRAMAILTTALMLGACSARSPQSAPAPAAAGLPTGAEPVLLDPARFSTTIDNPWWPMAPGDRWVFEETGRDSEVQTVVVEVTDKTRTIAGIEARVVHDTVRVGDELIEDTFDWYAQDADGNVWYLGEDTKEYENGAVVSTAGSWEHGVDGALAGIAVPAAPQPGLSYRQEYYAGEAEDTGLVLSVTETVAVPAGSYTGALMTKDTTPLDPEINEYKFYARGVGPVMAIGVSPDFGTEVLVRRR